MDDRKFNVDNIPGLDLSDPKQLAEFARYVIIYLLRYFVVNIYLNVVRL